VCASLPRARARGGFRPSLRRKRGHVPYRPVMVVNRSYAVHESSAAPRRGPPFRRRFSPSVVTTVLPLFRMVPTCRPKEPRARNVARTTNTRDGRALLAAPALIIGPFSFGRSPIRRRRRRPLTDDSFGVFTTEAASTPNSTRENSTNPFRVVR